MKAGLSVLDQAVVSATNFLTSLLLARICTPDEYGAFVIALSILLFLNGLQASIICGPMMVIGAAKTGDERNGYFKALFTGQLILSLAIMTAVFLALAVSGVIGNEMRFWNNAFLMMGIVIPFVQVQEFFKRMLITSLSMGKALAIDLVLAVVQLGLIFGLWRYGNIDLLIDGAGILSAGTALASIGIATTASAIFALWLTRGFLRSRVVDFWKQIQETFAYGKWLLGTHFGGIGFSQATIWAAGIIGGHVATANVEATRLMIAPAQIMLFAGGNFMTPFLSEQFSRGGKELVFVQMKKIIPLWTSFFFSYALVIVLFGEEMLDLLFNEKYTGVASILTMWMLVYVGTAMKQLPGTMLIAMKRPDIGMMVTLSVGAVTTLLTVWFMSLGGEMWAVFARFVGEVLLFATFFFFVYKVFYRRKSKVIKSQV